MTYQNITVFGGGNAAFAVAATLSLQGAEVTLCDFPEFEAAIAPVGETGFVDLIRQDGPYEGKAKIHKVTTNLSEAVDGSDLVVVCTQAAAHGRLGKELSNLLQDGQHVLLLPGSCFGAWEFKRNYELAGGAADIKIAESNTLVFATRRTEEPHQSRIKHWATQVFIAGLTSKDTEAVLIPFQEYFPQCEAAEDILETCLFNLNPYVHSAPAVLSISAVERCETLGKDFFHYVDGITPSTARVMIALDEERVALARKLGYRDWSVAEIFYRAGYMSQLTGDWVADMQSKPVLKEAKGPFNRQYRYYTEDTGVGLTVVHALGKRFGIPMPSHEALIHLCGVFNETDYFQNCSRTPEVLGMQGDSPGTFKSQF